ncbi:MAG: CHRD domain-containing protein [Bacteroidia bacterium]|nr:CHRD domain-containing protein [Bacteroidia bacterium]MBT8269521.1 CHRD domain-containing protein [Bacteroidia bacterium]NNF83280.1 CHRD domain-containing protein [Flavobacteriaceae bacterium]NNK69507.1 CHRD domain-containing protein [Flavobacteriaceae bacterium]NNL79763.1 CHRD domain-containing protein [Flavobacteriaceae bacterium]
MLLKNTIKTLLLAIPILLLVSCSTDRADSEFNQTEFKASNGYQFNASLKGSKEVPANDSKGAGQAVVRISKDETKIHYKLITANVENVLFAHFHMAPAGSNGGVVATLYFNENPQPSGPANGVLAEGYIMADNVSGALEGDIAALVDAIRNGMIYVNVHTTAVPSGELRGQL